MVVTTQSVIFNFPYLSGKFKDFLMYIGGSSETKVFFLGFRTCYFHTKGMIRYSLDHTINRHITYYSLHDKIVLYNISFKTKTIGFI